MQECSVPFWPARRSSSSFRSLTILYVFITGGTCAESLASFGQIGTADTQASFSVVSLADCGYECQGKV